MYCVGWASSKSRAVKHSAPGNGFSTLSGAVLGAAATAAPSAHVDVIDPEMNIITNPPTALMPPTLNGGVALNFTALTGFALVDPGGILEILNNTGAALGNLSIALIGTADSADANGVLTCAFNQSDYTGCSAHSSAGTGNPLMMPGQPPWTWNFTGGSVAAGAEFRVDAGVF
jgi:hypothetical protein